jgi:rSAM/selenodomain-associated transferase 2
MAAPLSLTVVVPTLDEGAWLSACLATLPAGFDVIVADGGSTDDTVAIAHEAGARVVHAEGGRGPQLNAGARAAQTPHLLFLHADVRLPSDPWDAVHAVLEDPTAAAGCFRVRHVPLSPRPLWFRALLRVADLRSRNARLPYGDQALFLQRQTFLAAGGYPDQPLLEDLELSRRLARLGRVVTLPDTVEVSARAFERGLLRHGLALNTFPLLHRLGVPTETLARWYRRAV